MTERTRTYTWSDPSILAAAVGSMPGLAALCAIVDGTLPPPPVADLCRLRLRSVGAGRAVFEMQPAEWMLNPMATVHGGILATVLDSAMGCACHTVVAEGSGYTTLDLQVRYVRPVRADGPLLVCTGTVVTAGRRIITAEGRIEDDAGRIVATATTSCMVLSPAS